MQENARSGTSYSPGASSHHHDDRLWYPARLLLPLVVAARDDRAGRTLRASERLALLDFTWAVNHQRVGGEGKVRSVRERQWLVAPCFGCSGLGTALPGGTVTEARYQTFDDPFVSLKNWSVS